MRDILIRPNQIYNIDISPIDIPENIKYKYWEKNYMPKKADEWQAKTTVQFVSSSAVVEDKDNNKADTTIKFRLSEDASFNRLYIENDELFASGAIRLPIINPEDTSEMPYKWQEYYPYQIDNSQIEIALAFDMRSRIYNFNLEGGARFINLFGINEQGYLDNTDIRASKSGAIVMPNGLRKFQINQDLSTTEEYVIDYEIQITNHLQRAQYAFAYDETDKCYQLTYQDTYLVLGQASIEVLDKMYVYIYSPTYAGEVSERSVNDNAIATNIDTSVRSDAIYRYHGDELIEAFHCQNRGNYSPIQATLRCSFDEYYYTDGGRAKDYTPFELGEVVCPQRYNSETHQTEWLLPEDITTRWLITDIDIEFDGALWQNITIVPFVETLPS